MIQPSTVIFARSESQWQDELRGAVRSVDQLLDLLDLRETHPSAAATGDSHQFPLRVPMPFVKRMRCGDANDPLLMQVLTTAQEALDVPGFTADPLQEMTSNPLPGLIHKYHGRVLLMPTAACAVHCRYCFRRHFPYADNRLDAKNLNATLDYIAATPSVSEVILSGGDPLVLEDAALSTLLDRLESLPQIKRVRIHSRLPVVIPQRLTDTLSKRLLASRLDAVLVIHCNHAQELDDHLKAALRAWRDRGITLLNQAVLLAGINDSVAAQTGLSEALFEAGVLPYYLHQLDAVAGAAHFGISDDLALAIDTGLRNTLPGYLVPKLVREIAGDGAKRPLRG